MTLWKGEHQHYKLRSTTGRRETLDYQGSGHSIVCRQDSVQWSETDALASSDAGERTQLKVKPAVWVNKDRLDDPETRSQTTSCRGGEGKLAQPRSGRGT